MLGGRQAAAGAALGHVRGDPAVDLGVARVAEPHLDAGAEDVADLVAEVHPPRARDDDVHPEGQPAPGELVDLGLELVELGAHRGPAVDDEEDVAVAVVDPARGPAAAVGLDGVDAVRAEVALAGVDDAAHLGHEAAHHLGLAAVGDPGDVRELGQRRERAAAEVEDVDLALERRGRERDGRDDGAGHRASGPSAARRRPPRGRTPRRAAARRARGAARAAGRRCRPAARTEPRSRHRGAHQAELGVRREVAEQLVHRVRHVERRQPHLVRGPALALHPRHRDVEHRARLLGLGRARRAPRTPAGRRRGDRRRPAPGCRAGSRPAPPDPSASAARRRRPLGGPDT